MLTCVVGGGGRGSRLGGGYNFDNAKGTCCQTFRFVSLRIAVQRIKRNFVPKGEEQREREGEKERGRERWEEGRERGGRVTSGLDSCVALREVHGDEPRHKV